MNGQQTTGKQRAIRIPLDYFKQPNPLERWKLWLSGIALLLAAGWIIAGLVQSDQGRSRYSRGPLAKVHAAWDTECSACHVSFSPINSSNPAHAMFGKSRASDQQCMNCHEGHE